ncbi:hypothetical protein BGAL_0141g00130 [Botrytis galanthina]|uniref:F-box domain-containing protein n=1 Tax=Botrytis galanthina TaxID=278940 RepID=A0A4S8QYZ4_9HELO|nr:hypothetical protein BGAL_0141g00130 [Botrytis galanthina]
MDSNVWSIPWPRELPVVVRSLQKLPREIVHQVLSDLPVIKILSILSWKLPYLDECVLSHRVYGRLFTSQGEISHALNHYPLYREICWFYHWPPADVDSVFAKLPQTLWSNLITYPLDVEVTGLEETLANVSLHNGGQETNLEDTELATISERDHIDFKYPEKIAASLRVVLKGLMYIYTEPPLTIPRIQWESLGDEDSSEKWPRFFVDKGIYEHLHFQYPCANKKIKPYDEREYEWLAAFVEVVTWIELNIGPVKEDF